MTELSVTVGGHDILVTKPDSGQSVTYGKLGYSPMLIALDPIRGGPQPEELSFLVQHSLDSNGVI